MKSSFLLHSKINMLHVKETRKTTKRMETESILGSLREEKHPAWPWATALFVHLVGHLISNVT